MKRAKTLSIFTCTLFILYYNKTNPCRVWQGFVLYLHMMPRFEFSRNLMMFRISGLSGTCSLI